MKTKVSTCMQVCILRETVKQEKKKKKSKVLLFDFVRVIMVQEFHKFK